MSIKNGTAEKEKLWIKADESAVYHGVLPVSTTENVFTIIELLDSLVFKQLKRISHLGKVK